MANEIVKFPYNHVYAQPQRRAEAEGKGKAVGGVVRGVILG